MTSHTNPSQLDVLLEILGVLNVAAGQPNRLTWNDEDGTLDLALAGGNVTLQLGQEEVQYSYNDGGTTIVDGNVVYTSGAQGSRIAVRKAQANLSATSKGTIGIATESILNGGIGFITTRGLVRDIKTDVDSEGHSLVEGDRLYLSATVLGGFSKTPPVAANAQHVFVGYVIRAHATVGSIFVQTAVATDITELQGANISTTPTDRSLIQYDSSLGVWKDVSGLVLPAGGTLTGTSPFKLTTQPTPLAMPEQGVFELVGNSLQFTQLAKRRGFAMSSSVITTTTTISNSTVESGALITADHGANYLEVGKSEEIVIRGTVQQTVAGAGVLQVRTKYAGVTLLTATTVSANIPSGTPFEVRIAITVRSVGTTGTMQINAVLWIDGVTNTADAQTIASINTTVAQNLTVTAQWTVANASNTISVHQGRVLSIEPSR